ncbi:helix-turn-helix domain-containing protein [Duganella sp. FT135W]|uniref:Helix-turn-helix domain-containing protein n=1 Tax=Duganella flavida TaxID=2692175 RepID=A0A6L8K3P8_9BURK|nr:AraC family transcriptional regulator [Duganella flavida]MYM21840.1 helix-turn-helix domain-containing protein [Duganella flavida]
MRSQEFALPVQYIRQIADQVARMNAEMPASFRRKHWDGMPSGDVQLLPLGEFEQLVQDAITTTAEPAFGLLVGDRMQINSHGMLGYAAMNSATLREAIALMEQYLQIRTLLVRVRHAVVGAEIHLSFEEAIPLQLPLVRRSVLETIVLTIKNLFDHITAGAARTVYASFPFSEPPYAALAREMFGCAVRYEQAWCGFVFPADALDIPLSMADPITQRQAIQVCQKELDKTSRQHSWAGKLQRLLLETQSTFPSLNVAARLLNVTSRTLHRRLVEEGTSYRDVIDEVRQLLAVEHLKVGKLSVDEIAFSLGYTDTANFRRAFIRWTGLSPSAFRDRV